jgi:hypothetical protein
VIPVALRILSGQQVPLTSYVDTALLTEENIDQYYQAPAGWKRESGHRVGSTFGNTFRSWNEGAAPRLEGSCETDTPAAGTARARAVDLT